MQKDEREQTGVNDSRTSAHSGPPLTRDGSRPVRFRLLGPDGTPVGWTFETAKEAGEYAALRWPHLKQDEDRTGKGWDVEVDGS